MQIFRPEFNIELSDDAPEFAPVLGCLVTLDRMWLEREARAGRLPTNWSILTSGVRYSEEEAGEDRYLQIPFMLRLKRGDCEDIVCAYVAECQFYGRDATAFHRRAGWRNGRANYHILALVDGREHDPSLWLTE